MLGAEEHALHVHPEDRVPIGLGGLGHRALDAEAGIAQQHVDPPEAVGDRAHGGGDLGLRPDIGGDRHARPGERGGDRLGRRRVAVEAGDGGALLGAEQRRGAADAGPRAGDDDDLVPQAHGASSLCSRAARGVLVPGARRALARAERAGPLRARTRAGLHGHYAQVRVRPAIRRAGRRPPRARRARRRTPPPAPVPAAGRDAGSRPRRPAAAPGQVVRGHDDLGAARGDAGDRSPPPPGSPPGPGWRRARRGTAPPAPAPRRGPGPGAAARRPRAAAPAGRPAPPRPTCSSAASARARRVRARQPGEAPAGRPRWPARERRSITGRWNTMASCLAAAPRRPADAARGRRQQPVQQPQQHRLARAVRADHEQRRPGLDRQRRRRAGSPRRRRR